MIDHMSIGVNDFEFSTKFYDKTLESLGYIRTTSFTHEGCNIAGYGQGQKSFFWISKEPNNNEDIGKAKGFHLSFLALSKDAVDNWYMRCLENGGKCNGKPGPRPYYHPGYYGAFIIDPNGWRIEACFHQYQA